MLIAISVFQVDSNRERERERVIFIFYFEFSIPWFVAMRWVQQISLKPDGFLLWIARSRPGSGSFPSPLLSFQPREAHAPEEAPSLDGRRRLGRRRRRRCVNLFPRRRAFTVAVAVTVRLVPDRTTSGPPLTTNGVARDSRRRGSENQEFSSPTMSAPATPYMSSSKAD